MYNCEYNYITKYQKSKIDISNLATLLIIKGSGDLIELLESNIPQPHEYKREKDIWEIGFYLDGVFWTEKGNKFLQDIIARFALNIPTIIETQTKIINKEDKHIYKLKTFQNLESLNMKDFYIPNHQYKKEDKVFWALKIWVENYLKRNGNNLIPFSILETHAFSLFAMDVKDHGTLRAKCRSIWNWYNDRDWQTSIRKEKLTKKELKMTRQENAKKVAEMKTKNNYKKVVNTITGLAADEMFKTKSSGKWNAAKIAKYLSMDVRTVRKYLKKYLNQEVQEQEKQKN